MHRALVICQAIVANLQAASLGAAVSENGVISLDDAEQELPAVDVSLGSDSPLDESGVTNMTYIDSLLEIRVALYAKASTLAELVTELMRLRSVTHQVLLAGDRTQGLLYVIDTRYGGAADPRTSLEGSLLVGQLDTSYAIYYRMGVTTPE